MLYHANIMKFRSIFISLAILLALPVLCRAETDYMALMAEESEIKAIAVVTKVRRMSGGANGSFTHVIFKRIQAFSPYIPKSFVGGCTTYEHRWQKRSPDMVYFKPRKGHKVYVTITSNGGAITSYTKLNRQLETVLKEQPWRITYSKGRALVIPEDE